MIEIYVKMGWLFLKRGPSVFYVKFYKKAEFYANVGFLPAGI
jgi:hypothetical protein